MKRESVTCQACGKRLSALDWADPFTAYERHRSGAPIAPVVQR